MWPTTYDAATAILAVALCSGSVKLLDDLLDRDSDLTGGRFNLAVQLGNGTAVYAVLLLALAAAFNAVLSLSLFLASYTVGMFHDLTRLMPSRLNGWQESLLIILLGIFLFGWRQMVFALLFIIAIQLIDDCVDRHFDRLCGQRNFASRLGVLECLLVSLAALTAACWLDEASFIAAFCGAGIFYLALLWRQGVKTCF